MAQSYDKLGLTQLRDDADRVMRKNFPDPSTPTAAATADALVAALVSRRRGAERLRRERREPIDRFGLVATRRHRRQGRAGAAVVHRRHARVADDQQAAVGLAADQAAGALLERTAASATK